MISAIGSSAIARAVQLQTEGTAKSAPAPKASGLKAAVPSILTTPAAELASAGAPVDTDKVAAVRAQIASGNYTIDASAIAKRMMALDLPIKA